jgi:hypothetical protein
MRLSNGSCFLAGFLALSGALHAQNEPISVNESPQLERVVYLLGDAGRSADETKAVFDLLEAQIGDNGEGSTIVFLGDNIYPGGMPEKDDKAARAEAEAIIDGQIERLEALNTPFYFIPGNHDWNNGARDGLITVNNEEDYIQENTKGGNIFIPSHGCPGPKTIELSEDLVMIAIDTQWWLHMFEKPPIEEADCDIRSKEEFIVLLQEEIEDHADKHILVVGHHPIYSDGPHGGYFEFKQHLFPLTDKWKNAYLPLPIIGSFYPFYRQNIGHAQDIIHPNYQELLDGLHEAFEEADDLIYAAGHEHSLQYYTENDQHFIVSGSAGRISHSSGKNGAEFNTARKGYFKLKYYSDGSVGMETWSFDENYAPELLFEKQIVAPEIENIAEVYNLDPSEEFPESVKMACNPTYEAGAMKKFFFGSYYRDAWTTPVDFPVINLYKEKGGLTPIKMGGGMQTKSLRLEAENGEQFVLRTVRKYPWRVLPDELQDIAVAKNVVDDQISASHPFSAYMVTPLAEAAGILYTKPKAVYLPDSPNLLEWRSEFGGHLMLFEQRAQDDLTEHPHFGYAVDAINTDKMIQKRLGDHDLVIDDREVLRNRIFDNFLGDWDRHEGQWRWGEILCTKDDHSDCIHVNKDMSVYVPMPKDRDQAFAMYDGLIPWLMSCKFMMQQLQSYKMKIRNIEGLNHNARNLDRFLLTGLERQDWIDMSRELQGRLTDEVLESALQACPDTLNSIYGDELLEKMKWRRDHLEEIAMMQYENLAGQVNVIGSEKDERIEVYRLNNDSTRVQAYRISDKGKNELYYDRTFLRSETKEIRIYGLGGKDLFQLSGEVDKGILVRVIGGYGKDRVEDASIVHGLRNYTHVYDTPNKSQVTGTSSTKVHLSQYRSINSYKRSDYNENIVYPNAWIGSNPDDGFFIGGGITYKTHGFRKEPFKASHRILGNIALRNAAFNMLYTGIFTDIAGSADLQLDFLYSNPKSTNFFGYGNETILDTEEEGSESYLTRFNSIGFRSLFAFHHRQYQRFRFGPQYQNMMPVTTPERFMPDGTDNINQIDQDRSQYASFIVDYEFDIKNKKVLPTRGMYFFVQGTYNQEVSGKNISNTNIKSKLTLYIPMFESSAYVFNLSGTHVFNEFEYYHSATLGGLNYTKNNDILRGFRRDRFSGRSSFAINNEIRLKLFDFQTVVFPGQFGISGFYDIGRVWQDDEVSNKWHSNVGGGIWISPLDAVVLNFYYAYNEEEPIFKLIFGFMF